MDPTIDIGMPVYNGAFTIERAIDSVLSQSYRAFRLVVSDNASSDGTRNIVERYAATEPRVTLEVQPHAIGAYANFYRLLHKASSDYFVFLAADDWWSNTFLEQTLAALRDDSQAQCCVPRTAFYADNGNRLYVTSSTSSLTDVDARERARRFLVHPSDCSRFYGLHRREAFAASFDDQGEFHAGDWYITLLELLAGTHLEVPHVLLHRSTTPTETYVRHWRQENAGALFPRSPLRPMRHQLKRKLPSAEFRAIRQALARLDARLLREHRSVEKRARAASSP